MGSKENVMRDIINLINFWQTHSSSPLSLCTLIARRGSSYRLPGAKKLIAREAFASGLLSGGCLERDIEETARSRWDEMPFIQSFNTLEEQDRWLGYQTGCAGEIDILFEQLPASFKDHGLYLPFGRPKIASGIAVSLENSTLGQRQFSNAESSNENIFLDPWIEPLELVIIGAGLDAPPFFDLGQSLGWSVRFIDHRETAKEVPGARLDILSLDKIADNLPQGEKVALVLMTHNFEADLTIFKQLLPLSFGYLGCLGPQQRFLQLASDLKSRFGIEIGDEVRTRIHAPAGFLSRQKTPETIALSVVAQIQSILG